jgi:hypothetical protein
MKLKAEHRQDSFYGTKRLSSLLSKKRASRAGLAVVQQTDKRFSLGETESLQEVPSPFLSPSLQLNNRQSTYTPLDLPVDQVIQPPPRRASLLIRAPARSQRLSVAATSTQDDPFVVGTAPESHVIPSARQSSSGVAAGPCIFVENFFLALTRPNPIAVDSIPSALDHRKQGCQADLSCAMHQAINCPDVVLPFYVQQRRPWTARRDTIPWLLSWVPARLLLRLPFQLRQVKVD